MSTINNWSTFLQCIKIHYLFVKWFLYLILYYWLSNMKQYSDPGCSSQMCDILDEIFQLWSKWRFSVTHYVGNTNLGELSKLWILYIILAICDQEPFCSENYQNDTTPHYFIETLSFSITLLVRTISRINWIIKLSCIVRPSTTVAVSVKMFMIKLIWDISSF